MQPIVRIVLAASALLGGLNAAAQAPVQTPSGPSPELARACAALPPAGDTASLAVRSQCVLAGVLPSQDPIADARELARRAMQAGDGAGGYMLYLVFGSDPQNTYMRDGKVDMDAYRKLGARNLSQRKDQIEAIEGLGFAAGKGNLQAAMLLAGYFYDTNAPQNVVRVRAIATVLSRGGDANPMVERLGREASAVERSAAGTKASVRTFLDAYRLATATASTGHAAQTQGKTCERPTLKSVSSGDIQGPEYLPLTGTLVSGSYLVKGRWQEFWTFDGCGEQVPVKVSFEADGWGGATFTAAHNVGQ